MINLRSRKVETVIVGEGTADKSKDVIQAALARKAEYQAAVIPLRANRDEKRAAVARLKEEETELKTRLEAFEKGEAEMEDAEYMTARDRLRLLAIRIRQAEKEEQKASMDLSLFYVNAQGEIQQLRDETIHELDREYQKRRDQLAAEFQKILINLNS